MEALFILYVITVMALVAYIIGGTIVRAGRMLPEESGLTPIYTSRCAGRIGRLKYSWPMVRVAVYPGLLVIASRHSRAFTAGDIDRIEYHRKGGGGSFGPSFRIHHRDRSLRSPIYIFTPDTTGLSKALEFWKG